ncbi:MAG: hypothetical protein R3323_10610 [Wenzhouxiangellaceae bacterium]|nr:hypothetical protein [Wenzhouxiangellaceae bacterium]
MTRGTLAAASGRRPAGLVFEKWVLYDPVQGTAESAASAAATGTGGSGIRPNTRVILEGSAVFSEPEDQDLYVDIQLIRSWFT